MVAQHMRALYLNDNSFSTVHPDTFIHFTNLKVLHLADNNISHLDKDSFKSLTQLEELFLSRNILTTFPNDALNSGPTSLIHLSLNGNAIVDIPVGAFKNLTSLRTLGLEGNRLTKVPEEALSRCRRLEQLDLSRNHITVVQDNAFSSLARLESLRLDSNQIKTIGQKAFNGMKNLQQLELKGNLLTDVPAALQSLEKLTMLELSHNHIPYIPDGAFMHNSNLAKIVLDGNDIIMIGHGAFINLSKLTVLRLSRATKMHTFPNLNGTHNLQTIVIDNCGFSEIPQDLCKNMTKLETLELHYNNIKSIPDLSGCRSLRIINLGKNAISSLDNSPFKNLNNLQDLILNKNRITHIRRNSLQGLDNLLYLDMSNNSIVEIHPDAFEATPNLNDLNLANNEFPTLPSKGFDKLIELKVAFNDHLIDFPPKEYFPSLYTLRAASAYHCCDYLKKEFDSLEIEEEYSWLGPGVHENSTVDWSNYGNYIYKSFYDSSYYQRSYGTYSDYEISDAKSLRDDALFVATVDRMGKVLNHDGTDNDVDIVNTENYEDGSLTREYSSAIELKFENIVDCKPMPDPFWPCEQLLGSWWLRIGVWIVFVTAILGNAVVILMICVSRTKMDVPRFLILNLACADFAMGLYIGFLAIVDVTTMHEFRKHGLRWQKSNACNGAGFMAVFSSELSIYTLTVITLERFYAIRHAVNLNKRLKLRPAAVIMIFGWIFAMTSATLPLIGINSYHRFSVCLPFETRHIKDVSYIATLMTLNGLAFLAILLCYMSIYYAIQGSHAWNCNDSRVAQRMSLLIFTDFICWAPIAFFSLTSVFGIHLIKIEYAKFLTVFILPINSFFNPFLYTIFTQHFKKDLKKILQRCKIQTPKIQYYNRSASHSNGRRMSPASHDFSKRWHDSDSGLGKSQHGEPPAVIISVHPDQRQNSPKSSPQCTSPGRPRSRLESESTVATRVTIESRLSTTVHDSSYFETSDDEETRHNRRRSSAMPLMQTTSREPHIIEEDLTKMSPLTRLRHFSLSLLSPRIAERVHDSKPKQSIGSIDLEVDPQYNPSVFSRRPIRNTRLFDIQGPFERSRGSSEGNCSPPPDWDNLEIRTRANSLPEKGRAGSLSFKTSSTDIRNKLPQSLMKGKTFKKGEMYHHRSEIQHLLAPGDLPPSPLPNRHPHKVTQPPEHLPIKTTESVWQRRPNDIAALQAQTIIFPSPSITMSQLETRRRLDAAKETTL
ncbi:lutropin-choriogonadotropic hormone receptor-like [Anneissia japonica]|uniref:lutropin-choriogonadotropic hormone receptor-like n=1 Tax=Anneissia japonica TaxID=1529436 RepID=UPI001425BB67|nr:lutropin-choriogonadotropic hormone receptor-like [Anneissia japonica]